MSVTKHSMQSISCCYTVGHHPKSLFVLFTASFTLKLMQLHTLPSLMDSCCNWQPTANHASFFTEPPQKLQLTANPYLHRTMAQTATNSKPLCSQNHLKNCNTKTLHLYRTTSETAADSKTAFHKTMSQTAADRKAKRKTSRV